MKKNKRNINEIVVNKYFIDELLKNNKFRPVTYTHKGYCYLNKQRQHGALANGRCLGNLSRDIFYLKKGKLHREDGPAHIGMSLCSWYFNGIFIEELENEVKPSKAKIAMIMLKYSNL
jgi:hypothetical protein